MTENINTIIDRVTKAYNPDEERDDKGQWTAGAPSTETVQAAIRDAATASKTSITSGKGRFMKKVDDPGSSLGWKVVQTDLPNGIESHDISVDSHERDNFGITHKQGHEVNRPEDSKLSYPTVAHQRQSKKMAKHIEQSLRAKGHPVKVYGSSDQAGFGDDRNSSFVVHTLNQQGIDRLKRHNEW